jgi:hypothetical protein
MKAPLRNRGTYAAKDAIWSWVFGSSRAAQRFLDHGRIVKKRMRLSTLGYDPCDFAVMSPSQTAQQQHERSFMKGRP